MSRLRRSLLLGICLITAAGLAAGQDLGSSNKLFGGPKKTTKSKTPAKEGATPKPTAAKPSAVAKAKSKPPARRPLPSAAKAGKLAGTERATAKTPVKKVADVTRAGKAPGRFETFSTRTSSPPPVRVSYETEARFEDLIEDGNIARDERNYAAAEAAYKQAKPLKPSDPRAIYGLGNLYSDQHRWEEAEAAYRSALKIDPSSAIPHIALSYVLTQPLAAPNLSERYEEAERLARRAILLAPSNALAFDQLGVSLELRGQIGPETESAYRRAILLNPSFAPAHAHLGRLLRRRGLAKESAAAYKEAVERADNAASKVLVAEVMQSEQRFAESEKLLAKALEDDPRNPSGLLLMARALTAQGKFSDAERTLRSVLSVNPNSFAAYSLLGSLYLRQGKIELAETSLLSAARLVSPLERRLLSQQFETVGDAYMKNARRLQAERAYRKAMDFDADSATLAGKLSKARFG